MSCSKLDACSEYQMDIRFNSLVCSQEPFPSPVHGRLLFSLWLYILQAIKTDDREGLGGTKHSRAATNITIWDYFQGKFHNLIPRPFPQEQGAPGMRRQSRMRLIPPDVQLMSTVCVFTPYIRQGRPGQARFWYYVRKREAIKTGDRKACRSLGYWRYTVTNHLLQRA